MAAYDHEAYARGWKQVAVDFKLDETRKTYNQAAVHAYDMNIENDVHDTNQTPVQQYESRMSTALSCEKNGFWGNFEKAMEVYKVDPKDVEAYRPYKEALLDYIQADIDRRFGKKK